MLLERGESVPLDATWGEATRRRQAESVAATTYSPLQCWLTVASEDVVTDRVRREAIGTDASQADPAIAAELARRFEA